MRPVFLYGLTRPAYHKRVGVYAFGNRRSRADVTPFFHGNGRNQVAVAAYKTIVFYDRPVFILAVIVYENRAATDIAVFANVGVSYVR